MNPSISLFRFTFRGQIIPEAIKHISNHMKIEKIGIGYLLARGTDENSYLAGRAEGVSEIRVVNLSNSPPAKIDKHSEYIIYDGKC